MLTKNIEPLHCKYSLQTIADDRSLLNVIKDEITELKKYKLEIQESFKKLQEVFKSFQVHLLFNHLGECK